MDEVMRVMVFCIYSGEQLLLYNKQETPRDELCTIATSAEVR